MEMTKKAKAVKAAYLREWHTRHPEKRKQYTTRYWNRKAKKLSESAVLADTDNLNKIHREEKNHEQ